MSISGSIANSLGTAIGTGIAKGRQKAAEAAFLRAYKKGKTQEQVTCIDFLFKNGGGCGKRLRTKMKIEDYEQVVANRLYSLNLRQKAIDKIGLDEDEIAEIPPIILSGYVYESNDDIVMVRAEHGRAVSSRFSVSWIFFSQTQMYTYTYTFDTISDTTYEKTQDFFFQDITCFTTLQKVVENIESRKKGCLSFKPVIEKNNFVVDYLEIQVPGASFSASMRNNETLEQSLQGAKAMLRERKFVH